MKFGIIGADSPWQYNDRRLTRQDGKVAKFGYGSSNSYECQKTDWLADLPVMDLADQITGCVVPFWATGAMFPEALRVLAAWGFNYATMGLVWLKCNLRDGKPWFGPGNYTSQECEFCPFGVTKKRPVRVNRDVHQTVLEDARPDIIASPHRLWEPHHKKVLAGLQTVGTKMHSGKPTDWWERVIRLYGDVPRIELFARLDESPPPPGTYATGLEYADELDIRDAIPFYQHLDQNTLPDEAARLGYEHGQMLKSMRKFFGEDFQYQWQTPQTSYGQMFDLE